MFRYAKYLLLLPFLAAGSIAVGQTYLYFQDSPTDDYYDASWMELTAPSELERKGADLRKFPVETVVAPEQGMNSLRLKWKSMAGGAWVAIAAGTGWTAKDIHLADTLQFWLYSAEGLDTVNLPKIFMEDVNNAKTTKHTFSDWCPAMTAATWVKVMIPMDLFLNAGDAVDFTRIKTIGFAQNTSDGVQHTLLIDNMRVFQGSGTPLPANPPQGVAATGYDSHVEVQWQPAADANVTGYAIQRKLSGALSFTTIGMTTASDTLYEDHVREFGSAVTAAYRVLALNGAGDLSAPSDTVEATTRDFTDAELLDMLQQYTFRYFWNFAHPASGMARERNTSGNTITTGGSGFGIMAILTGIERGFITREQGIARMNTILGYLETADRFHGVWPHWLDGNTGMVVPFSTKDNGGDLVETAFLMEGLLTARQYFNQATAAEESISQRITALWEGVEWDWYRQNNSDGLYWHWSPNYGWSINMRVQGWNEAAIIYLLAIASPTHGVPASLWHSGWAGSADYVNGKTFYGYPQYVGWDKGGPLFFAHYSFIGFDPRDKKDAYANYFKQNRNHTLINRAYCMANPYSYQGYGENCWGLTASDDPDGYMAHEPASGRDNGTITPTAALSSMPYTPEESLNAFKYFYRNKGKKIWGPMGFYDAFNMGRGWYADSYLAIDQGPIIGMVENYRSQLLWNKFMANPEITPALDAIGFTEDLSTGMPEISQSGFIVMPNPGSNERTIRFNLTQGQQVQLTVNDMTGRLVSVISTGTWYAAGTHEVTANLAGLPDGMYLLKLTSAGKEPETITLIKQQ